MNNFYNEFAENSQFIAFLRKMSQLEWDTNTTTTGEVTIQQTLRNQLRSEGLNALLADLIMLYGVEFDVVNTKEGIAIIAENEPTDSTLTWMMKSTIKSLDFDPFLAADAFTDEINAKAAKKADKQKAKEAIAAAIAEKRAKKLATLKQMEQMEHRKR